MVFFYQAVSIFHLLTPKFYKFASYNIGDTYLDRLER